MADVRHELGARCSTQNRCIYLSQHGEAAGVQLRLLQLHDADPAVLVQVLLVIVVT